VVVADPTTTEAELRRILRAAGARIVDGPTQANAYVLEVPAQRQEQAMRALRAEHALVLVERLGPQDTQ
jgi:outer membrane lipopolysaccharide assembly protein LptE/RlpB